MADEKYISKLHVSSDNYLIAAAKASADNSGRSIASAIDKIEEFDEIDYNEISIGTGLKLENNTISVNTSEIPSESYYNLNHSENDPSGSVQMGKWGSAENNSFAFNGKASDNSFAGGTSNITALSGSIGLGYAKAINDSFAFNGLADYRSVALKGYASADSVAIGGFHGGLRDRIDNGDSLPDPDMACALQGSIALGTRTKAWCAGIAIKGCTQGTNNYMSYAYNGGVAIKGATAANGGFGFGPRVYANQGICFSVGTCAQSANSVDKGFAVGQGNTVYNGFALGNGLLGDNVGLVIGQYNKTTANEAFVIGGGSADDNRKDRLIVPSFSDTGFVSALNSAGSAAGLGAGVYSVRWNPSEINDDFFPLAFANNNSSSYFANNQEYADSIAYRPFTVLTANFSFNPNRGILRVTNFRRAYEHTHTSASPWTLPSASR